LQARHTEAALPHLREAESLLARNGKLDSWNAGYLFSYLAQALNYTDGPSAIKYAEQAVKILRRDDPDSLANLVALWMLADAKRATDPPTAEAAMRDAMGIALKLYGTSAPVYGDSAMLLADIQADQLKIDAAERNFQIAAGVAAHATEGADHLLMQTDLRYGKFLVDIGKVSEGQARIEKALARSLAAYGEGDRKYTGWSREYAAIAWWRRGQLVPALEQVKRSLAINTTGGIDALTAKLTELNFDLLLLHGDVPGARQALQLAHEARSKSGTSGEAGFQQGLMLRDAHLALATGDAARAESLYRQVAAATMPPTLRFRRYHLDAAIGVAKAQLLRGNTAAATSAADSVLQELRQLGDPAIFADRQSEALIVRGRSFAAANQCAKAQADWTLAATLLRSIEDPDGYRGKHLAQFRRCGNP
jgi:hypothetical protein